MNSDRICPFVSERISLTVEIARRLDVVKSNGSREGSPNPKLW